MRELLISLFLVTGSGLFFLAALGLVRLPDAMCRAHGVAKATCLGILLILLATGLALHGSGVTLIILATGVFQLLTTPISAHLLGRLAFRKNIPLWRTGPLYRGAPTIGKKVQAAQTPPRGSSGGGDSNLLIR
jgi:multicomponent Na+:H+ antiporter subunit G